MKKPLGYICVIVLTISFLTSMGQGGEIDPLGETPEADPGARRGESPHAAEAGPLPFSVQVAAYRVKGYAYRDMNRLRAKGYDAYVFRKSERDKETLYTVRIGHYRDADAASQAASQFRDLEERPAIIVRTDPLSAVTAKEKSPDQYRAPLEREEGGPQKTIVPGSDDREMEADDDSGSAPRVEESLFAGSLFDQAVGGESTDGSEGTGQRIGGANLEVNGYVRAGLWPGRAADTDDAEARTSYGEVSLKLRARKGNAGDGYAEFRVRNGVEAGEQETNLDVREAYVNVYSGPFDVRFGRQIILWGRADSINPTNNLTPYDQSVLSPDEDDRRLANFGIRSYYNATPFRLEGVWMPTYAESHFPDFSLPALIQIGEPDYPGANLSGGLGAGRLHYETPDLDASVSYLYGYATYPGIELRDVDVSSASPIIVGLTAYRHAVIGCDFSTTVGDGYGLRGEMAYRRPLHYEDLEEAPMPELYYVVGVDREFHRGEISVIVQYIGRYVFDWSEIIDRDLASAGIPSGVPADQLLQFILDEVELKNRMIQGQQDRVSHAGFIRAEWKLLQETLSLELVNFYNFTTQEVFFRPKVSYDIADALNVTVGGDIYHGPDKTLFGTIDESQNAGFVEMKVSF